MQWRASATPVFLLIIYLCKVQVQIAFFDVELTIFAEKSSRHIDFNDIKVKPCEYDSSP